MKDIVSLVMDALKALGTELPSVLSPIKPFLTSISIMVVLFGLKALLRKAFFKEKALKRKTPTEKPLTQMWGSLRRDMDSTQKRLGNIFKRELPEKPPKIWHFFWILLIFSAGLVSLSTSLNMSETFDVSQTFTALGIPAVTTDTPSKSSEDTPLSIRIASFMTTGIYLFVLQSLFWRLLKDHLEDLGLDLKFRHKIWFPAWAIIILIFGIISLSASLKTLGVSAAVAAGILGISLQTPLQGIVGWLMLMARKTFKEGDHVRIGSIEGKVANITMMSVVFKAVNGMDSGTVYVPNSTLFDQAITNFSSETDPAPEET